MVKSGFRYLEDDYDKGDDEGIVYGLECGFKFVILDDVIVYIISIGWWRKDKYVELEVIY